jgi:hypothetical protein
MRHVSRTTRIAGLVLATTAAGSVAGSATAHAEPQGFIEAEMGVGYFYSTFDDGPNMMLLVGGTAEDFCEAAEEEGIDPFAAEPGRAPVRVFQRASGATDLKVNDKGQPIYLYDQAVGAAPEWIGGICADWAVGDPVPEPYAAGTADLKVRISITEDAVDVFNSVNGELAAVDGTEHRVRASADLVVVDGEPVGDPADFVSLDLIEIRR